MTQAAARVVEQRIKDPDGRIVQVMVNRGQSPLAWLFARGKLSERQYGAGEQLRMDWERAGLSVRVTMNWMAVPPDSNVRGRPDRPDPTLAQMSARDRFHGAIAMAGPGLADILWRVACAGEGLAAAERALGWPTRAGKLVLTLALDRIAVFYRL